MVKRFIGQLIDLGHALIMRGLTASPQEGFATASGAIRLEDERGLDAHSCAGAAPTRNHPAEAAKIQQGIEKDLLKGRPDTVIIEVTSKCNLRCHYCPKADPLVDSLPHVNTDMSDAMLDTLYAFCKSHGTKDVTLSGVGETAMHAGWHRRLGKFLDDPDFKLYTVSNFARPLDDDDLAAFLRFDTVQVSFDSSDFMMVRKLRSKANLGIITYNIVRLKQKIREAGAGPSVVVNCTLLRDNIGHLADLARFCRELGVDKLLVGEMMNLTAYNTFDGIEKLTSAEIRVLADQMASAREVLAGTATVFEPRDSLLDLLWRREADLADGASDRREDRGWGSCLQPWSMPLVRSDGKVFACCIAVDEVEPVGDLATSSMAEIFDGTRARAVRADILAGRPSVPCATCVMARKMPPEEFKELVRNWL